ncbi:uncharacterized protein KY384_007356 [Bacidia gigantensis]|uniref:uncharacterized protein n=1 Tax=Bacidia gigantensis TaxID=2732470 RepID=UPI001D036A0A|nr:uncharacterized protein KY384_007356 [Bacidia gigantensis]KAG8528438.1 hypothetical protein KY384_007356 [Bacidia gigantensis]
MSGRIDQWRNSVEPGVPQSPAFEEISLDSPILEHDQELSAEEFPQITGDISNAVVSLSNMLSPADIQLPASRKATIDSMQIPNPDSLLPPLEQCPSISLRAPSPDSNDKSSSITIETQDDKRSSTVVETQDDQSSESTLPDERMVEIKDLLDTMLPPTAAQAPCPYRTSQPLRRAPPLLSLTIPEYESSPGVASSPNKTNNPRSPRLLNGSPFNIPTPTDLKASERNFAHSGFYPAPLTIAPKPLPSSLPIKNIRTSRPTVHTPQSPNTLAPARLLALANAKTNAERDALRLANVKVPIFPYPHLSTVCEVEGCPVGVMVGKHEKGPYLHGGKLNVRADGGEVFGASNPPENVWLAWGRVRWFGYEGGEGAEEGLRERDITLVDAFVGAHYGFWSETVAAEGAGQGRKDVRVG